MTRNLNRFVPPVLKAIDRQLLLNRPVLWATRFHFVLFYALLALILVSLKVGTTHVDPARVPHADLQGMLWFIPALLGIALWAWKAQLFDARAAFGQLSALEEIRNQLLFLGGVLLIGSLPFVYGIGLSQKVAHAVDRTQLVTDINTLNAADGFFLMKSEEITHIPYHVKGNYFLPHFGFTHPRLLPHYEAEKQQTSSSWCKQKSMVYNYMQVMHKYSGYTISYPSRDILAAYQARRPLFGDEFIQARDLARKNIFRISTAQAGYGWFQTPLSLQSMVLALLMLALTFWIFVRSKWKLFLGAVVLLLGLILFAALSASMLRWMMDAYVEVREVHLFLGLLYLGFVALLLQGWTRRYEQSLHAWQHIALMTACMMLPVLAFFSLHILHDQVYELYRYRGYDYAFFTFGLSVFAGSWCCWNALFRPKLDRLHAAPKA
ncbi:MAG: hypothetical protein D6730_06610 [Bacteroidetes bacterium]|nr:MAG: hypothetical protein D6730_06610 [Bacteroidota bacterium]